MKLKKLHKRQVNGVIIKILIWIFNLPFWRLILSLASQVEFFRRTTGLLFRFSVRPTNVDRQFWDTLYWFYVKNDSCSHIQIVIHDFNYRRGRCRERQNYFQSNVTFCHQTKQSVFMWLCLWVSFQL